MMGTRSPQDKLFAADHIYLDFVGRETLYGYLAQNRRHLFRDEDFAGLYCENNGRTSVPPSLAISILFLRAYEGVSFVEAIDRTKYDLRWKLALGDCAYGGGPTRRAFADEDRVLTAKVPVTSNGDCLRRVALHLPPRRQECGPC